jgi:hypothetical protein
MSRRVLSATALTLLLAAPARADLTIAATGGGKAVGMAANTETVTYLKGHRMRADTTLGDNAMSTIIDLDKQQFISLNHKKREAELTDMSKMRADLEKIASSDISVKMTPTGQKKTVAGQACDEYSMDVRVPMAVGNDQMTIVMTGPVWIAKDSPGKEDYAAFYQTAAEKGLFFTDPRVTKAQPGNAKGMAALYKAMADAGVAYESTITIKFEGGGMLGGMMSKMGGSSFTTTVTNVSTGAVDEDKFQIPAEYKTKENR